MSKKVTWDDIAKNNGEDKKPTWLAIGGKAYDVTEFLCEHPGGEEVIMEVTGKDATEDYEDVGHSDEARSMMAEKNDSGIKVIGTIEGEIPESMKSKASEDGGLGGILVPVLLLVVAAVVYTQFS